MKYVATIHAVVEADNADTAMRISDEYASLLNAKYNQSAAQAVELKLCGCSNR